MNKKKLSTIFLAFFLISSIELYAIGITIPINTKIDINSGTLNVPGDISIAGELDGGTGAISLTGNWTNTGTFTDGTSTVTFNGTLAQTVATGGSDWNEIEVTNAVAGGVTFSDGFNTSYLTAITPNTHLNFAFGQTFVITAAGGLNINGQATGTRIILRRFGGIDPAQWSINPSGGAWTVSYVDVKDSLNLAVAPINPSSSINTGNNTNWFLIDPSDTDGDGLPDLWELYYFGNLAQGPADNPDLDAWTNLEEYQQGFDPTNASPDQPVGVAVIGTVSLTPTLGASDYSDAESNPHLLTEWQVSSGTDFADTELIFEDISIINKETIQLPLAILKPSSTYYWRVRYADAGGWSLWSVAIEFLTETLGEFLANNEGITVVGTIQTDTGNVVLSFRQDSDSISSLSSYAFYSDVFSFRIEDIALGATANVTFLLDDVFETNHRWLKLYPSMGIWDTTYGDNIVGGTLTRQVTLQFQDGGFGDVDGLANGVIVDPSGPAIREKDSEDDEEYLCFIATAAYGTAMAEEVQTLRQFRNEYLLTNPLGKIFVRVYYNLSPRIAGYIKEYPVLKEAFRIILAPIIWISEKNTE